MSLRRTITITVCLLSLIPPADSAFGQQIRVSNPMAGIDLEQRLNAQIPLDVPFTDENGVDVKLDQYFHKRPVALNLIFYKCPGICITEMDGMTKAFKKINKEIGKDFEVVTISIDPRERPNLAKLKKDETMGRLKKPGAEKGWHFLTGTDENIHKVADSIGFKYAFDKKRPLQSSGGLDHPHAGRTHLALYTVRATRTRT